MRKYAHLFVGLVINVVVVGVLCTMSTDGYADSPQDKVFIFFYASDCKYCHESADMLVSIAKKHKIKIIANSLDNKPIEQFPHFQSNNNLTRKFKITSIPTIVAVDMQSKSFEVVSYELEAQSMLEAKILAVLNG